MQLDKKSPWMSMAARPSGCPVTLNFGSDGSFPELSVTKMSRFLPANGTALIKSPHCVWVLFLS